MVWVYERTDGSLSVAILMHASLTAFAIILFPPLAVAANLISGFTCAAAMWLVVAVIAIAQGGHLSRQRAPEAAGRRYGVAPIGPSPGT